MNILKSTITKLGNKIELIGTPSDNNILIIGVFHGDEPQGKYLIEEYLNRENPNTPTSNSPLSLPLSHKGRGNKCHPELVSESFPINNLSNIIIDKY